MSEVLKLGWIRHRIGVEAGGVDRGRGGRLGRGQDLREDHLHVVGQRGGLVAREVAAGAAGDRHRRQRRRGPDCMVGSTPAPSPMT